LSTRIVELFGIPADAKRPGWEDLVRSQSCPFLDRKCVKVRKSVPDVSIGTCIVAHGQERLATVICPKRLQERQQIFFDCFHLLGHEPGNEVHAVPEVEIPGGSLDFVLVSARDGKVRDFVGIELQTLDTTGTLWPERQRFLHEAGITTDREDRESRKPFGMNWKMTAKTILVQLHHKIRTFEHLQKRLVLVVQDRLLEYMRREFSFGRLNDPAFVGDPMHIHAYRLLQSREANKLALRSRTSTDVAGVAAALGLQADPKVGLDVIVAALEAKMSDSTRVSVLSR